MTGALLLVFLDGGEIGDYRESLRKAGYDVQVALGGLSSSRVAAGCFDAAVLVGRQAASAFPLLTGLAARSKPVVCVMPAEDHDEIALLDAGATLCLPPDAHPGEVSAWIRALLDLTGRRWPAGFDFDPLSRQVRFGGAPLRLRPTEFDLLLHLASHAGHPLNAAELQRRLWPERVPSPQRLAVIMHNLRAALAVAGADGFLRTIPGAGYVLSAERPAAPRRPVRQRTPLY